MHTPDRYRKILLFLSSMLSALLIFSAAAAACLDARLFDAPFHKQLMEKYDIYGKLEKTADNAVQEYIKNMDASSSGNEEQKDQFALLLDKAVTPEMVRLNADTLVEGLMDYFSGKARFLPDIYLKPVDEKPAAVSAGAPQEAPALLSQPLAGVDRISLNVILMYLGRNDTINLLSEIRLFKFALSHLPVFLLLLSMTTLVPALFLAGKRKAARHAFAAMASAGLLCILLSGLALLLGLIYLPRFTASSVLAGYIGKDALSGYLGSCIRRPAVGLAVCGAALTAAGLLVRHIPWSRLPEIAAIRPGRPPESKLPLLRMPWAFMRKHGKTAAALLLVTLLAGVSLARLEAVENDFHAKDLSAAFERLKRANTYSTVIAARDEIIYAVEVRTTDGQSGDPVQGIPVKIDGKVDAGGADYSVSGSSDESGKARFDIGEGSFRLEFDSALFPQDYKVPASYNFEIKAAGIAIITVHLDRAEGRKAGIAEVLALGSDDRPAGNLELTAEELEMDGTGGTASGKVFSFTNNDGVAVFKLPEGRYRVSFVESAFPEQYMLPSPMEIEVDGDATVSYSLKLALRTFPAKAANN